MFGDLLERLTEAVDELADLDVDVLEDADLHATVTDVSALTTRLEAIWCRLIGAWDRRQLWADNGSKSPAARLARETHRRRGDCDRLVRRARDLQAMPATSAAYAAGKLSGAHADLVASCNREWRNAEFADSEQFLVDLCRTPSFHVAYQSIEYWKQLADRDAADRHAEAVRDGRHLSASFGWHGELVVDGALDPLGGEIVKTQLDRICDQLRRQDLRDGVTRTATQRRADALVEMATRSATAPTNGLRPRPLLTVTIGIDPFNHLCHTAAGTVIAPGLLIPHLTDADIERIVYDPPNRRVEASHRKPFTGALRRIIEIRDGHCQHHSGCDEPASRCDIDHIVPRSRNGITCLCNGQPLCAYHNRTVKAADDRASPAAVGGTQPPVNCTSATGTMSRGPSPPGG